MKILEKLGITKESVAKLLGVSVTVDRSKQKKLGRPKGRKIPYGIVEAVRSAHRTYTNQELADKYGVSYYWVYAIRKNMYRRHGK